MSDNHFKSLFPVFKHHPALVYLDAAATMPKPESVISAERAYEEQFPANISRGLYPIAEEATARFDAVRAKVAHFLGTENPREIIFTSGATHAINLAAALIEQKLSPDQNIVTTELEHHSNFLPWKELALKHHLDFRVAPVTKDGRIDIEALVALVDEHTRAVACSALSNVTGGKNDISTLISKVREKNPEAFIVIDAAQAIGHEPINVTDWDADFVAFSGHKLYGPTGIGILFGKESILESSQPVSFGGGMVLDACAKDTLYKDIPERFEAGTPNISGVMGLGAAIDFIDSIGLETLRKHEKELISFAWKRLSETFGESITLIGPSDPEKRGGLISFALNDIHPHDLAHLLGEQSIALRAGEHCAAPLHRALKLPATARISFGIYNTEEDIEKLISGIETVRDFLKKS